MSAAPKIEPVPQPANDVDGDVLDVAGAMAVLRVGRDAVYAGCARREIPHRRVGKVLRFSRAALMRWLDSNAEKGS